MIRAPLSTEAGKHQGTQMQWLLAGGIIAAFLIVPFLLGGFAFYIGTIIVIYAISALGLQLMVGLAGQLSLGHAAFMGVSAYASVILQQRFGLPFLLAGFVAVLLSALAGLLMAQLIRLSGVYFKIATFGFGIICFQMMHNWTAVTGGHNGLSGIPPLNILGLTIDTPTELYLFGVALLAIVFVMCLRLLNSRVGRAFACIGQNDIAARSIGIPVERYKMSIISLGCAFAGVAGLLIPPLYQYVSPEYFSWHESLVLLIMITVGGTGSFAGAIIGAVLLILIPEYMRDLAEYKMLVYGLILVLFMIALPSGIAGLANTIFTRFSALVTIKRAVAK